QSLIEALSLPILRVWDGVIAVPLIGPLDEARAADTLERLLDVVVASSARHVIIDLTGLMSANANSAAYLVTMIRTLGLVGSRCVLAGIRPALSTMFVEHELPLGGAECFSTQAEALAAVLGRLGWSVCRTPSRTGAKPGRSRL
ncbi:MAG: STAS domain-containing protein, partial [Nannocystaceae bacterium]